MKRKTDKQHFFEVELNWQERDRGSISARDAEGMIQVATPPQFGGEGHPWTPEHYLLSAVSSCFMTTFLLFVKKLGFEISGFSCDTIGEVELVEGKYKFTNINLYPKITLNDARLKDKAAVALEKAHKYCLITNTLNATVFYHSEILIDDPSTRNGGNPEQAPAPVLSGMFGNF